MIKYLIAQGANVILLGCTEIPLALEHFQDKLPTGVQYINSADILGRGTIDQCMRAHLALNKDPLIDCINQSLTEYTRENKGHLQDSSHRSGVHSAAKLLKLMQASLADPENYEKFVDKLLSSFQVLTILDITRIRMNWILF